MCDNGVCSFCLFIPLLPFVLMLGTQYGPLINCVMYVIYFSTTKTPVLPNHRVRSERAISFVWMAAYMKKQRKNNRLRLHFTLTSSVNYRTLFDVECDDCLAPNQHEHFCLHWKLINVLLMPEAVAATKRTSWMWKKKKIRPPATFQLHLMSVERGSVTMNIYISHTNIGYFCTNLKIK